MNMKVKPPTSLRFPKFSKIDAGGVGICVAGLLLLCFAGIRPNLHLKEAAAVQITQMQAQQEKVSELQEQAAELTRELDDTRKALDDTVLHLIPASRVNRRISEMTDLATDSKLRIDGIEPGQAAKGPLCDTVPLLLSGRGRFPDCVAFLHRINKNFPDISVESLELTGNPANLSSTVEFRIHLLWYASPE